MGFLDKLLGRKDQAADSAAEHGDTAKEGVDKAGDVADEKTGGEHTENIDAAGDKAKDAIDDVAGGSS